MKGSSCDDFFLKKEFVLVLIMVVTGKSRAKDRVKKYDGKETRNRSTNCS